MSDERDDRPGAEVSPVVVPTTEAPVRRPASLDEAFEAASTSLHGLSMHYSTGLDGPAVKLSEVEEIMRELESEVRRLVLASQGRDE